MSILDFFKESQEKISAMKEKLFIRFRFDLFLNVVNISCYYIFSVDYFINNFLIQKACFKVSY